MRNGDGWTNNSSVWNMWGNWKEAKPTK
jgi:hypothetical protein